MSTTPPAPPSSSPTNGNINSDSRCQSIPDDAFGVNGTVDNITLINFNNELQGIANSSLISVSDEFFALEIALLVIGGLHIIISSIIYTYMYFAKSNDPSNILFIRIKKRSLFLNYLNIFITTAFLVESQITEIIWTPCWITNLLGSFLSPLIGIYGMAKTVDFFNKSSFHRLIKEVNVNDSSSDLLDEMPKKNLFGGIKLIFFRRGSAHANESEQINDNHNEPEPNAKPISKDTLRFVKLMLSPKVRHVLLGLVFAPYIAFVIAEFSTIEYLHPSANCYGCDGIYDYFFVGIIYAALTVILDLFIAFKSREFPDNFGLVRENIYYLLSGSVAIIAVSILSFPELSDPAADAMTFVYWVGYQMMHFVASTLQIIFAIQEEDNPNVFARFKRIVGHGNSRGRKGMNYPRKDTVASKITDLSTSIEPHQKVTPNDEMKVLLENKYGSPEYNQFEQYLAGEFATENIKMYTECSNWRRQYFDVNVATIRSRAKRIVSLYVKTDSVFYVNLPATMRERLEKLVLDVETELEQDLFDDAQKEMFRILEGAYMRFKRKASIRASLKG